MVSPAALNYSDKFNYPLTLSEIWYWQPFTSHSAKFFSHWPYQKNSLLFLPGRGTLVTLRRQRFITSLPKWAKAKKIGRILSFFPTISAIFITGSLSMNNSPAGDDIDFMIITSPHTLWFTRALVDVLLSTFKLRRTASRITNKICDNLWLDENHLLITKQNLYTAHEILQAKCIFTRGSVYPQFVSQNSWVKNYLPIAYRETMKQFGSLGQLEIRSIRNLLLWSLNLLFFFLQYLYMRPRLTSEKIGLGYAFFHPHDNIKVHSHA
jgi:hypothetical protein